MKTIPQNFADSFTSTRLNAVSEGVNSFTLAVQKAKEANLSEAEMIAIIGWVTEGKVETVVQPTTPAVVDRPVQTTVFPPAERVLRAQ